MCKATALSGFTANVLDITEKKSYPKTKKIQNISRIPHVKYDYSEAKISIIFTFQQFLIDRKSSAVKFQLIPEKVQDKELFEQFGILAAVIISIIFTFQLFHLIAK